MARRKSGTAGYEVIRFALEGVAPLLMHDSRGVDPLFAGTQALAKLTAVRKKTVQDHEAIAQAEWNLALWQREGEVVIPARHVMAMLRDGARKSKRGKDVQVACFVEADVPLEYEGPRDLDALYGCGRFVDRSVVRVQSARVVRTRPRFDAWGARVEVGVFADLMDPEAVVEAMRIAGERVGLGDYRPFYGRFAVEVV